MFKLVPAILSMAIIIATPAIAHAECVKTYWIPFDAELYAPESETSIKARAFEKNYIPESIANSLNPKNHPTRQTQNYNPRNVRAVIFIAGSEIYIDRFGWIRQGSIYGKTDVLEINKKLSTPCSEK